MSRFVSLVCLSVCFVDVLVCLFAICLLVLIASVHGFLRTRVSEGHVLIAGLFCTVDTVLASVHGFLRTRVY